MTSIRKDLAATVLTVLAVLAYATTHEGWDVWLIGDHHRWATAAIVLLGAAVIAVAWSARAMTDSTLAVLTSLAVVLAAAALASGSLTPLSLLVVAIVVVWLVSVGRDVVTFTHHATPA